jgi:hypothetical protein
VAVLLGFLVAASTVLAGAVATPRSVLSVDALPGPESGLSVSLSFSPSPAVVGTNTTISVSIGGGTAPFNLWVNNSPPGCAPPTSPFSVSSSPFTATCQPQSSGQYTVHLDVIDSMGNARSASTPLTVNPSNGNGNEGNSNSNSSNNSGFQLPAQLVTLALIFGGILVISLVILAAGVLATAILVSRRLRQLAEVMEKSNSPPTVPGKPPQ